MSHDNAQHDESGQQRSHAPPETSAKQRTEKHMKEQYIAEQETPETDDDGYLPVSMSKVTADEDASVSKEDEDKLQDDAERQPSDDAPSTDTDTPAIDKREKGSFSTVIIILVIFSLLTAIPFLMHRQQQPSNVNVLTYNNYEFIRMEAEQLWYTKVQLGDTIYDLQLHNFPKDLEDIPVKGNVNESFMKPYVYIAFDPVAQNQYQDSYVALAAGQLSLNLAQAIKMQPLSAYTTNASTSTSNFTDNPVITCASDEPVIILNNTPDASGDAPTPEVVLEGTCVQVHGTGNDILRASERLLYHWYGIMQ
ncbi:hypothetical protein AUJ68_07160 [Candidatus Woesearchaeota archaeon CG1_02_57_44]|nr:MAG: hypothetical protein AUJ68_07160 [Candidatus Woesearchaeota archaeon CG1_02_57_44]PIN67851.1 MAG: hypothetical protein COV94_06585 [Candidatus Woesearchaeota archaeon CG11_big_fil_rev_8_21_14_0_20_57_5]